MQGEDRNDDVRQFWVATLADKFKICECSNASIRDLKRRIQDRMVVEGVICLLEEGGNKELPNSMTLSELTNDTTLVCAIRGIETLESEFSNLPSPGCKLQKYLRWLQGIPAGDERVLQSLWFVSVLSYPGPAESVEATDPAEEEQEKQESLPRDEVDAAVILGLADLWRARSRTQCESGKSDAGDLEVLSLSRKVKITGEVRNRLEMFTWNEIRRTLEPHYRATAHADLLEWILEEGSCRLRVIMAELDNIFVRGADGFVRGRNNSRQIDAFKNLLAIANCDQNVVCWA